MKKILYDVRQDAIKKLKTAKDEDSCRLIDAALYINALSKLIRKEGLPGLELFIEDLPELLQLPIELIVDAYSPKKVVEFATNDYWSRDPLGIQAMIS